MKDKMVFSKGIPLSGRTLNWAITGKHQAHLFAWKSKLTPVQRPAVKASSF